MTEISPNAGIRKQIIHLKVMVLLVHAACNPKLWLFYTVKLGWQETLRK